MSNERSPRAVCSTTIGTRGMSSSLAIVQLTGCVKPSTSATRELHNEITGRSTGMTERIERELVLEASPSEVWHAVTDGEWLAEWLADEVSLELVPGGEAWFRFGETVRTGWVEEIAPPD